MKPLYILVGGAPTSGKSTLAKALAKHLDLPYISTDQLRKIVKPYATKELFPTLFDTENLTAETFLTKYTPQEISDAEFSQGEDVWPAIEVLLQPSGNWAGGCVIEGVNVLPHHLKNYTSGHGVVKTLFIVDLNEDRIREVVYKRGVYDRAETYSDDVKETEVEWVMLFAQRLKKETARAGLPVLQVTKTENDLPQALQLLGL